jgi:hypothetical protein
MSENMMTLKDLQQRVNEAEINGVVKVNIDHEGEHEGIWACLATPKDKEIYDRNTEGETINVYLMNQALIGGPTWGAKLTVVTHSDMRPTITGEEVVNQMNEAVKNGQYPPRESFKKE